MPLDFMPLKGRIATDRHTKTQRAIAAQSRPPPGSLAACPWGEPKDLVVVIHPVAEICWRWTIYDGPNIVAEGPACQSESGAASRAEWMLAHVLQPSVRRGLGTKQFSTEVIMSDEKKTQLQKMVSVRGLLQKAAPQIARALPKHLTPERMLRIVETCIQRNPKLLDADPRSLIGAVVEASQLGLEPESKLGHCHLVPFYNKKTRRLEVQLIIGYQGLQYLAYQSGQVSTITATVVYEKDEYEYAEGLEPVLRHIPLDGPERGEVVAAYAIATMVSGGKICVWIPRCDLDNVRDDSLGKIPENSGARKFSPWSTSFPAMCEKTAVRRLSKRLPLSTTQRAVALLEQASQREGQTFSLTLRDGDDILDVPSEPALESPSEPNTQPESAPGASLPAEQMGFLSAFDENLKKATTEGECRAAAMEYHELHAGNEEEMADFLLGVDELRDSRIAEIKGSRGQKSNQPKGT